MTFVKKWWATGLSPWVKFVFLVLLANGLPAFIILMSVPDMTDILFVWTINPEINARLIGVMYSNALLMVIFGVMQTTWPRVRVIMVIITLFSVLATLLTFFFLKPFLAHPWYHLTYWLTMYFVLFFAAPYVFYIQEKQSGGRLPIHLPLNQFGQLTAGILLIFSLVCGLGLIFNIDLVNQLWPWTLPPLVGALIGVLLITHTAAYAWTIWDGDWLRVRPMFWQAPITGLLFLLLPVVHAADVKPDAGLTLPLYYFMAGFPIVAGLTVILTHRSAEQSRRNHEK